MAVGTLGVAVRLAGPTARVDAQDVIAHAQAETVGARGSTIQTDGVRSGRGGPARSSLTSTSPVSTAKSAPVSPGASTRGPLASGRAERGAQPRRALPGHSTLQKGRLTIRYRGAGLPHLHEFAEGANVNLASIAEPIRVFTNFLLTNAFFGDFDDDGVRDLSFGISDDGTTSAMTSMDVHEYGHALVRQMAGSMWMQADSPITGP